MGAVTSKTFKDMMMAEEEDLPAVSTPVIPKRVLDLQFDPRSPTAEVARTPIQVEKTPETVLDPRSPTCGISRTPIYCGRTQSKESQSTGTPISHPASSLTDGSLAEDPTPESVIDDSPFEIEGIELINRSTSDADLASIKDDLTELLSESDKSEPTTVSNKESSPAMKPAKELFKGHTNTVESPSNCNEKGKDRGTRSPLKVIGESQAQRSPLGIRNNSVHVDSPRAIVQRKQLNKLGMLRSQVTAPQPKGHPRSPVKYKLFSDDKENLES